MCVLPHGNDEEENVEEGVQTEEEKLAAVVVPVRPCQVAGSFTFIFFQIGRFQPVGSTGRKKRIFYIYLINQLAYLQMIMLCLFYSKVAC